MPSKVRETLLSDAGGRLVLTAHTEERCLLVYPEPVWLDLLPKIQALPNMNKAARRTQRLVGNLEKKIMLIGQGSKMELWSEESWSGSEQGQVPID